MCLFCKIAAGEIPATIVHQDEQTVAFRDLHPQAPTHILVIPREHISSLAAATPAHEALLGRLLFTAARIAQQENPGAGFRLVANTGPDGGQTVDHLHLHLLGGRPMHWPPG